MLLLGRFALVCFLLSTLLSCGKERKSLEYGYLPKSFKRAKISDFKDKEVEILKIIDEHPLVLDLEDESDLAGELYLKDLLDSIWFVKLDSKESNLIGRIDDIKHYQDKIYILDGGRQSLFIFNSDGSLLKKINSQGKGPGEYAMLYAFQIDPIKQQLALIDDRMNRALYYGLNGEFISEEWIPYYINDFVFLADSNIAVNIGKRNNAHIPDINNYKLIIVDRQWHILKKALTFEDKQRNFKWINYRAFNSSKDKVYYHPPYGDTIFSVSTKGLVPEFILNLGTNGLPKNFDYDLKMGSDVYEKFPESRSLHNDYEITSKYLLADLIFPKGDKTFVAFDFEKKKLSVGNRVYKDKFNSAFFDFPEDSFGDTLVTAISAGMISFAVKSSLDQDNGKQLREALSKEVFDMVMNTNAYDNPVLLYYTLKQ